MFRRYKNFTQNCTMPFMDLNMGRACWLRKPSTHVRQPLYSTQVAAGQHAAAPPAKNAPMPV